MRNRIIIFTTILILNTISFTWASPNDIDSLLPLEKENLINWVNEYCGEHHSSWNSLINDGYIKCKIPRVSVNKDPNNLWQLKGLEPVSINASFFSFSTKYTILLCCLISFFFFSKKISRNKKIGTNLILLFALLLVHFDFLPELETKNGVASIKVAIKENYLNDIKHYISSGEIDPNKILYENKSILDLVAEKGFPETVNYVSTFAPEVNQQYEGQTKLLTAVRTGNKEIVRKAIRHKKNRILKIEEPFRENAFDVAAYSGDLEVLKILYENFETFDNNEIINNYRVLRYALASRNIDLSSYLISYIKDIEPKKVILLIASNGSPTTFEEYIRQVPEHSQLLFNDTKYLEKLFHEAALNGQYQMLEYLDQKHYFKTLAPKTLAFLIEDNFTGYKRIKLFSFNKYFVLMPYRMKNAIYLFTKGHKLSPYITDKELCNMTCYAVKMENETILRKLLELGVNPKISDAYGYTSYDYAENQPNPNILKILREYE